MAAYENQEKIAGEIFNIGGGMDNSLSLLELFDLLRELTETELSFIKNPPRQSDQRVFVADISKAKRLLNWEPKVTKREGISRMLEWVSSETSSR
jgi:CDP-paratose 2-epimerase